MGSYRNAIKDDLQTLRDDIGKLADTLTGMMTDKGGEVSDDVRERIENIRDRLDGAMSQASEKGGQLVSAAQGGALRETLESSVREYPLTMLAVAAGLGAAVAAQLRR
jgi:ElaB/YqjD/DUF883 family membrane-anchored ribosome-binding protein